MTCPPASDAHATLTRMIDSHGAAQSDLIVRVDSTTDGDTHQLHLRVSRSSGEVGVDRTYPLGLSDCNSAAELLALGVDRFLTSFPEWTGPPRPPAPPTPPEPTDRWSSLSLVSAVNSMWRPFGYDGHLGAIAALQGRRHGIGAGLLLRASLPQAAGGGRFQQTSLLTTIRYRLRNGPWLLGLEARAGALLVSGLGFAENRSELLPWWEGVIYGGRAVSWGSVGIEVAATGLRHKAVTSDGLVSEDIPSLRLGLAVELGVASQRP